MALGWNQQLRHTGMVAKISINFALLLSVAAQTTVNAGDAIYPGRGVGCKNPWRDVSILGNSAWGHHISGGTNALCTSRLVQSFIALPFLDGIHVAR